MSSLPIPYTRKANFTSFEASNPSKPKPGSSLDAEFNAVKQSIDATQSRLAEVQRDDGALANGIVTRDSLDENVGDAIDATLGKVSAIDAQVAAAQGAAAGAAVSEANAQGYANTAQGHATSAQSARNSAEGFALDAFSAASTANTHRNAAAASATAAANSAAAAALSIPTGAVVPFAGAAAPSGWLLCAGQEVSRTTYAALDAVIGTTYGAYTNGSGGAGTTHLRVPDLRGRVAAGKDNMGGTAANRLGNSVAGGLTPGGASTLGGAGGESTHTLTEAEIPAHNHDAAPAGEFPLITGAGWATVGSGQPLGITRGSQAGTNAGGGAAHNNLQPTIVLNYIIKT